MRGRIRIKILIAAVVLILCGAAVYAVRWYHGFYHHVTHEELSHEVKHSTFQATIRGGPALDLQLYQQEHAGNQPLMLFTSGDGGWSPFCADIAAHIAASGATVVGIDAKSYLVNFASPQKPISPEQLTHDYDTIARLALARPGIDVKSPLVLAGWSLGAGYSVIVASQPEFSLPVSRIVAISLPMYGELAALGLEQGKPFSPDARMKRILVTAAEAALDQMRVEGFASQRPVANNKTPEGRQKNRRVEIYMYIRE